MTGVDDALVIGGIESTALAYGTGGDALAVTPSLTLSDVDSRTLSGATVRVSVRFPVAVPGVSALQRVGAGRVPAGDGAITANTSPRIANDATGAGAAAFEVANNTVDGAQGITLTSGTGAIDAEIASNGLAGSAPITVQAGAGAQLRVGGNTLATGDVQVAGDPLCADVAGNTANHILLSTAQGFGIAGLFPDPADAGAAGDFLAYGPAVHLLRAAVLAKDVGPFALAM